MQAGWTRLKREEAHQVLDHLSGHRDAIVFSREATEVACRELPFYTTYRLYRLINYATMPTFSMMYLSNGHEFITIDGTANPIYAVNAKAPVRLTLERVVPYLDFFFSNVQGGEGDIFLIKDPQRMPFLASLSDAQKQTVASSFRPLDVTADVDKGVFRATGTLYYGGGLIAAGISVNTDGRIAFDSQQLLLTGIHFPYSPYSQPWLEG
jgi:hypothetical protein